ncbi:hypothetical protein AX15_000234 [Amanita polypyramis BW_CC]|nr:hypothetical protein AX15_000234 [Amanita polypyramis BW_CC]
MFFKERPITATLVAIFSLFSFLPVLAFVGASFFSVATVVFITVCATVLACGTAIITFLSLLLFALFVNFFLALFFTGLVTFAFLFLRLAIMVREKGTEGISNWFTELQNFILGSPNASHVTGDGPLTDRSTSDGAFVQATPLAQSINLQDEKTLNKQEVQEEQ